MPYPTPEDYVFDEGLDPTAAFSAPEATALLSFLRVAVPDSYRGMTISSETTPATSGQPSGYATDWYEWQKRCLWINPATGKTYVYVTGLGWQSPTLEDGVVDTANLADGAVTVAKIAPSTATYILRTNGAGTAVEFAALSTILSAGSVPLSALSVTGGSTTNKFLTTNGTSNSWGPLSATDVNNACAGGGLGIDCLDFSTARYVLRTNSGATATEYVAPTAIFNDGELPLTKISPGSGNANKIAYVNTAGTAMEFRTAPSVPSVAQYTSASLSIPAAGATVTATHGMASRPVMWSAEFVCTTTDAGYAVGDAVDHRAVFGESSGIQYAAYAATVNATQFSIVGATGFATINISNKSTGAYAVFTPANWALVFKGQIITS